MTRESPREVRPRELRQTEISPGVTWVRRTGIILGLALFLALAWGCQPVEASQPYGYDLSFPQCKIGMPPPMAGQHIVGVNGGRPFESNPCFAAEYNWARQGSTIPAIYMNLDYPHGWSSSYGDNGPRGRCASNDQGCKAFNYGYNAAADAVRRAGNDAQTVWWLDIESANFWSRNLNVNAEIIQGALNYFQSHRLAIGIYSIGPMWEKIAGNYSPAVPLWVAQWNSQVPTMAFCSPRFAFGGGSVAMVQVVEGRYDVNYRCSNVSLPTPSAARPVEATSSPEGTLLSSHGGSTIQIASAAVQPNQWVNYRLSFSPNGVDAANGLYVTAYQDGNQLLKVHATDTATPGILHLNVQSHSGSPITFFLTSYDDASKVPAVSYWLQSE